VASGSLNKIEEEGVQMELLACWVELTKTFYIALRESRNLSSRGVPNIKAPTFRLPEELLPMPLPWDPDTELVDEHDFDKVRPISHWSPYDPVGVVNAVP
jgi:hypothetical protein